MDSGEYIKFLGCFETYKLNVKKIKVYFLTEPNVRHGDDKNTEPVPELRGFCFSGKF